MEKQKNIKHPRLVRTLCIVVAVLFLVGFVAVMTPVLQPKYLTLSPEGSLTEEYYDSVQKTPHDVLFIGDCEVYESFVPAVLWEEYGISSYVRGGAQQLVWHSYYMLEDALRYETPQVVVFNVLALKYGEPQREAYNRLALDGMEWSPVKVEAIRASMTDEEDFLTYVFPFFRYHSRWSELSREDLTYAYQDKPTVSDSGYLMQTAVVPHDPADDLPPMTPSSYTLPESAMAYLDRMEALCRDKGIRLILVKAPTDNWRYHWFDEWDAQVTAYAEEKGLDYYNLIPAADDMGLDMATDSYDGGVHLNVFGAEKLTRYFGKILADTTDLADRRDEADLAAVWQERLAVYNARKDAGTTSNP